MNRHLLLLTLAPGLFLIHNVMSIAINGRVGLQLSSPHGWMAALPTAALAWLALRQPAVA